jgi:hypothetical protein
MRRPGQSGGHFEVTRPRDEDNMKEGVSHVCVCVYTLKSLCAHALAHTPRETRIKTL